MPGRSGRGEGRGAVGRCGGRQCGTACRTDSHPLVIQVESFRLRQNTRVLSRGVPRGSVVDEGDFDEASLVRRENDRGLVACIPRPEVEFSDERCRLFIEGHERPAQSSAG